MSKEEIVDMIEAEAEAFIKSISPPLDCILRDEDYSIVRQAIKSTYIAGRSKNIEREKELEAELAVTKESIKNLFDQIQEYEPHFHYIISQWDEYINLKNNL